MTEAAVAIPLARLVGETNPYQAAEVPEYALYPYPEHSAGGRLCRIVLGLSPRVYLRAYERYNLCSGKWSMPAARKRADELRCLLPRVYVVLLGAKVASAFGIAFEPFTISSPFVILPHPSGLSRLWNEPGAFERARALMRQVCALPTAASAPAGEAS